MAKKKNDGAMLERNIGAIFDCDGVVIDSAHMWRKTESELAHRAGTPLSPEHQHAIISMTIDEVGVYLHREIQLGESPQDVVHMINDLMTDFYRTQSTPMPGVLPFLGELNRLGVHMCVVSSSPALFLELGLKHVGAYDYFCKVFSVDDFNTSKRSPFIYEHALETMGTSPENTWGFEDSYYACQTMNNLGICSIGIYDPVEPYEVEELRANCSLMISDFAQLDPCMIAAGPHA